jgi:hypothetical protein
MAGCSTVAFSVVAAFSPGADFQRAVEGAEADECGEKGDGTDGTDPGFGDDSVADDAEADDDAEGAVDVSDIWFHDMGCVGLWEMGEMFVLSWRDDVSSDGLFFRWESDAPESAEVAELIAGCLVVRVEFADGIKSWFGDVVCRIAVALEAEGI